MPTTKEGSDSASLMQNKEHRKVLQVLKHIWAQITTGTVYAVLFYHYQLTAGISEPILKNPIVIPWSTAYWVDNLCNQL